MGIPPELGRHLLPFWQFFYYNTKEFCFKKYAKFISTYRPEIKQYHNIHKGKKCFILGGGPSLNKTNFSLIKDEIFFGVNSVFNGLSKFGISCKYYNIVDDKDLLTYIKGISNINTKVFLSGDAGLKYLSNKDKYDVYLKQKPIVLKYLSPLMEDTTHMGNIVEGVYSGCTVIGFAIQTAYYMGFDKICLLGCDCDYSNNHYFDGQDVTRFFGIEEDEYTWKDIFSSYDIIKKFIEKNNREIYNFTVGGKLEVFKRKKLENITW